MLAVSEMFWLDMFVIFGLFMFLCVCFLFIAALIGAIQGTVLAIRGYREYKRDGWDEWDDDDPIGTEDYRI